MLTRIVGFRGRTSTRSRSCDCSAELERAMSTIGVRLDVSQPHHRSRLPRQSNPAGLYSSSWTNTRPGRHRMAYLPAHISLVARFGWHIDECTTEAYAARSDCNHHERLWRRHDGIEARSEQQGSQEALLFRRLFPHNLGVHRKRKYRTKSGRRDFQNFHTHQ
jgi:hypothetical protein